MTWSLMQIVLTAYINVATYSHTAAEIGIWQLYTVNHKKTCHFVFDYKSGVTCSIFIIFLPVETGRNTVQFSYLMAWW